MAEREEISRSLASGQSIHRIAQALGRAPFTISREMAAYARMVVRPFMVSASLRG